MKTKKTPYYYLSGQRAVLMGLAILWVLWFHTKMDYSGISPGFLRLGISFLENIGYGGVDIFLLVSGIGIYQSLEKNSVSVFFKNRLKKILPVWWPFMVVTICVKIFLLHMSVGIRSVLGSLTFTGFWLGLPNRGNWYVHAIMLFYLVSPVLFSLLKNSKHKRWTLVIMLAVAFGIAVPFMQYTQLMAISRTLIYILGMYLCATRTEGEMTRGKWWLCLAVFLAGLLALGLVFHFWKGGLQAYGFYWWPYLLIAPCGSLMAAWLFTRFQKQLKALSAGLSAIGKASLEILLTSDILYLLLKNRFLGIAPNNLTWLITLVISVILGLLIHELIEFCKKKCGQIFFPDKKQA